MSIQSITNNQPDSITSNLKFSCFVKKFTDATNRHRPQALIFHRPYMNVLESYVTLMPEVKDLPKHKLNEVVPVYFPKLPQHKDYIRKSTREFDTEGFCIALDQFRADLIAFVQKMQSGQYIRALLVTKRNFPFILIPAHPATLAKAA